MRARASSAAVVLATLLIAPRARADDEDSLRVTRSERYRARSGLALAARASMPVDEQFPNLEGVRANAALAIAGPLSLGLAVSFEQDGVGPRNLRPAGYDLKLATSTAVLSLGAPWTRNVFGVSLEGGFAYGWRRFPASNALWLGSGGSGTPTAGEGSFVSPYARGAVYAQVPSGELRPWVSLGHSTMWMTPAVPSLVTSLEIGFAFDR